MNIGAYLGEENPLKRHNE